ncbi:hypothetical protein KKH43_00505 [Patescibacteria group bacterium]|nr:hypothetical protein [Patescibacteria group bacterium]
MRSEQEVVQLIHSCLDAHVPEKRSRKEVKALKALLDTDIVKKLSEDEYTSCTRFSTDDAQRLLGSFVLFKTFFAMLFDISHNEGATKTCAKQHISERTILSDIVSVILYDLLTGTSFDSKIRESMLKSVNRFLFQGLSFVYHSIGLVRDRDHYEAQVDALSESFLPTLVMAVEKKYA